MSNFKVIIKGIGAYLPGEKIAIEEIDDYFGKIPGIEMAKYYKIIEKYAGVKYRYYALEKGSGKLLEDSANMAYKAAKTALERAEVKGTELDLIITTTSTPPYLRAGLAKEVRLLLGNYGCSTYDLWGACTGIQQAITLATAGIRTGMFSNALLVGVELPSTYGLAKNYIKEKIGKYDMLLRAALGDGAGALVLSASNNAHDEDSILYTRTGTEGDDKSAFHREAGGSTLPLNAETFSQGLHHWQHDFPRMIKKGRPYFVEIIKRTLEAVSIHINAVDYIVPAAANFNYFRAEEYLKNLTPEEKAYAYQIQERVFTNFSEVGNIPSAAVYVALNELYEKNKLNKNSLLLLPSIEGATWGWGASLLKWNGS